MREVNSRPLSLWHHSQQLAGQRATEDRTKILPPCYKLWLAALTNQQIESICRNKASEKSHQQIITETNGLLVCRPLWNILLLNTIKWYARYTTWCFLGHCSHGQVNMAVADVLVPSWHQDICNHHFDVGGRSISRAPHFDGQPSTKDHDDVIKWKHFPRYRSLVNSSYREAGELRHHRTHCDGTVMSQPSASDAGEPETGMKRGALIHYPDVIMSAIASQITDVSIVYSTACSDADQRIHQRSASLAFMRGIDRWIPHTKGQ